MHPVDVVYQSGLGYIEPDDPAIAGVGMKGSRLPRVMRMSQPLPRRTLYRISHVPAPKPSDYAHVYVNDYAQRIENTRLETCYHPNLEMNRPRYVFRPRSPVCARKPEVLPGVDGTTIQEQGESRFGAGY